MPKPYVCPCCKGQLQASAKVYLDIDEDGQLTEDDAIGGRATGDYDTLSIYCQNDCFFLEDYPIPAPDDAEGWEQLLADALEAAAEAEEDVSS